MTTFFRKIAKKMFSFLRHNFNEVFMSEIEQSNMFITPI